MTDLKHRWREDETTRQAECVTCGVRRRSRRGKGEFPIVEYLVSGEGWRQERPACFVPGAEQASLFGEAPPAPPVAGMHDCTISGCKRAIPTRYLMCGRHWAMVPKAM
jgi:hypothetical protein